MRIIGLIGAVIVLITTVAFADERDERRWTEARGETWSLCFGAGVLLDQTEYDQDETNREQVGDLGVYEGAEVRTARVFALADFRLGLSWTFFYAATYRDFDRGFTTRIDERWRTFDLTLSTPLGASARITLGKMKEPFSLIRRMGLEYEPFLERALELDALLPARNVGLAATGAVLGRRATWGLGVFNDWLDTGKAFEDSGNEVIGRLTALPLDGKSLVHLGVSYRYSDTRSGFVRFRNTPEAFFSPDFVDTGPISADDARWLGIDVSWARGPFWLHGEAMRTWVTSPEWHDPRMNGAHAEGAWILTGEHREYDRKSAVFRRLRPARPATEHGPGLWEVAARYSRVNLSDQLIEGGRVDRLSGALNWYPTADSRVSFNYGFARLDRFGLVGYTSIYQLRVQLLLG